MKTIKTKFLFLIGFLLLNSQVISFAESIPSKAANSCFVNKPNPEKKLHERKKDKKKDEDPDVAVNSDYKHQGTGDLLILVLFVGVVLLFVTMFE